MWQFLPMVMPIITKVVDKLLPGEGPDERQKRLELEMELQKAFLSAQTQQIEVNNSEAQSGNLFVAGWRPAVGWMCAFAMGYTYIFKPLLDYVLLINGYPSLPDFSVNELDTLLMGMLGLGGLRTFEKVKDLSQNNSNQNKWWK